MCVRGASGPTQCPMCPLHPVRNALAKFWAPVSWLLQASIVLELVLLSLQQQAVALNAAQTGAGPYGLPVLPAKEYDATAITATLNDLMAKWHPAQGEYAGYFTWMPWKIDVSQEAKNLGVLTHPNTVFQINYYNVTPDVGISVESVTAPFVGAGFTPTPEDSIFVVLDGFSSPVPVAVARNVQHDFASGFVTRLVLDAYVSAAQLPGHDNYAGLKSLSLSLNGRFKANAAAFAQFIAPSTYQGTGVTGLEAAIALSTATANSLARHVARLEGGRRTA
jgi:hypothetical protein